MNDHSSRSHAIFTIFFTQVNNIFKYTTKLLVMFLFILKKLYALISAHLQPNIQYDHLLNLNMLCSS